VTRSRHDKRIVSELTPEVSVAACQAESSGRSTWNTNAVRIVW
jgi:hypothetical protein